MPVTATPPPASAVAANAVSTPKVAELDPVDNSFVHGFSSALATIIPLLGLGYAGWMAWGGLLKWQDLVVFAVMYIPIGLGVTVGFHRYFTHRSFKTGPVIRGVLGALGSAALEGPVIAWTAAHRRHHAFSDQEGDPHSPHVNHDGEPTNALAGLAHAHLGWIFLHTQRGARARYAPDLLKDRVTLMIDRTMVLWVLLGLALPFGMGVALTGSVVGGLTGLLWGGLVRIFLLHHITYSINSLCHFFGKRRFDTGDESRNLAWLAPFSMGEAWHNNHHAFPTSAQHGMGRWEFDMSGLLIRGLEAVGLVWDVTRVAPAKLEAKALQV
ncbi:MAG: hypothetical protein QOG62_262 [Thermoleophilaceae bacterium]|jgi:stearoyl-CoA desaturase (delta-9 desaturase)|nr:hypothetical protein [Thermoleophilaceae bacterium]